MNIFKLDFRRNLKSLLIWSGATAVITVLLMSLYPAMLKSDLIEMMNAKIATLPKELVSALNMSGEDFRQLPQFFAYMFQFLLMVGCIYGATLGLTALSREESEGTIGFLYAKPVRRTQIVSAKLAAACVDYFIFFAILGLAAILSCIAVKPDSMSLNDLVTPLKTVILGGLITGFTFLFLGFMISVFLRRARHAASLAVAIFFVTYILGNIPVMMGVLDFLRWISPMNYFVPRTVVMQGIDGVNVLICVCAMAVCTFIAYMVYRKKDFAV